MDYEEIIKTNGFEIHIGGVNSGDEYGNDKRYYYAYIVNPYLLAEGSIDICNDKWETSFNTLEEVKAVVQKFIDSMNKKI